MQRSLVEASLIIGQFAVRPAKIHDLSCASGFFTCCSDLTHCQDFFRLDQRFSLTVHYVDKVIELSSVAVHETASERVPDRGSDRSVQTVLPMNGVWLLVFGLYDTLRTEHLHSLIVSVSAIARQIDHTHGT